jgi:hypothetical protein
MVPSSVMFTDDTSPILNFTKHFDFGIIGDLYVFVSLCVLKLVKESCVPFQLQLLY